MSWEQLEKAREDSKKGKDIFIKLKDGDAIEGVFMGEPHTFYSIFQDPTEYGERVEGSSFKFRVNFFVKEDGKWEAKMFSGGVTVRDLILDAKDEYGLDTIFKIKRTGSGKDDTRYSVLPSKHKLTDADKDILKALPLLPTQWKKNEKHVSDEALPF